MLLQVLIVLLVIGIVLWAINTYVPMEPRIKNVLNIAVILIVIVWLLKATGVWGYLATIG